MIYPESFEQKTGFDKIKVLVKNKCTTVSAKILVDEANFMTERKEIARLLSMTSEMKTIHMLDNSFPDRGYVDTDKFLPKLRVTGGYLEPQELLSLRTALDTVKRISGFFTGKNKQEYPALTEMFAPVRLMPEIIAEIDRTIDRFGVVVDNASAALHEIRTEISSTHAMVGKRIQAIIRRAHSEGIVDTQSGITMRDGHAVIPVLAMHKRKLKGLILGESSSGKTVFVEPLEVVELNNRIKELEFAEQREIIKILAAIADSLRPNHDEIEFACNRLVEVDFIRAKASYAVEIGAGMPIIGDELQINLVRAKHPVLMNTLAKDKKEVVPLDVNLNRSRRILLISGPNAGGKSVCIKTVALLQYMMQCGFLIPASEISELGVFKNIFMDIGDDQSIENDLSTYSSHLTDMKFFIRHADRNTLILIDEFGTGTEPTVGGAIAEAVLAEILTKNSFGLITTHYTNLKYFASSAEGIVNGAMMFDVQQLRPLFKLETGIPGSSFAFEIARKIGIPEYILKEAESKVGDSQMKMERNFKEIAKDKKYWENKKNSIRKTDKYLDELSDKYEKELLEIKEFRKKLIGEAKEEAKKLLSAVNKEIENTIRAIKESQADKDLTKTARSNLEKFKTEIFDNHFVEDKIDNKINEIRKRKHNHNETDSSPKTEPTIQQLKVGDKVKIKGHSLAGEIISLNGNNAVAAVGNIIITVSHDKIVKLSHGEYKNSIKNKMSMPVMSSDLSVKRLNFKPVLDIRGERVPEALEQISSFVDEAMMFDVNEIRILHGKGSGILKDRIRHYLKSFGGTLKFSDETEEAGGAGITVVSFNN